MSEGIEPYDLVPPVHLLVPITGRQAELAAQRERERTAMLEALARAGRAWEALWDQTEQNVVATSVLLIHRPIGYDERQAVCAHCEQYNGYEDTEPVPWPCATYTAVLEAVWSPVSEPQDGVH